MSPSGTVSHPSKSERIVSLVMYLSSREGAPASRADIARNIEAYADLLDNDDTSRKRITRDLESLHELGIYIHTDGDNHRFALDCERSYLKDLKLSPADAMRLRLASLTPLSDPSFAYSDELRSAVTKIAGVLGGGTRVQMPHAPALSDEQEEEHSLVRKLDAARTACKAVTFIYTSASGVVSTRKVHPYGLFSISGDWYCVCYDPSREGFREFRVGRMSKLKQPSSSSKPDFAPVPFDIHDYIRFPFVYGSEPLFDVAFLIPVDVRREPAYLWDDMLISSSSKLPGYVIATSHARSTEAAARWAIEMGQGVVPLYPERVREAYLEGLEEVCRG